MGTGNRFSVEIPSLRHHPGDLCAGGQRAPFLLQPGDQRVGNRVEERRADGVDRAGKGCHADSDIGP